MRKSSEEEVSMLEKHGAILCRIDSYRGRLIRQCVFLDYNTLLEYENKGKRISDNTEWKIGETYPFFILDGVPKEEPLEEGLYIGSLKVFIPSRRGLVIPVVKNYLHIPFEDHPNETVAEFLYNISLVSPTRARCLLTAWLGSLKGKSLLSSPFHAHQIPFAIVATLMYQDKREILFPTLKTMWFYLAPPHSEDPQDPGKIEIQYDNKTREILENLGLTPGDVNHSLFKIHEILTTRLKEERESALDPMLKTGR